MMFICDVNFFYRFHSILAIPTGALHHTVKPTPKARPRRSRSRMLCISRRCSRSIMTTDPCHSSSSIMTTHPCHSSSSSHSSSRSPSIMTTNPCHSRLPTPGSRSRHRRLAMHSCSRRSRSFNKDLEQVIFILNLQDMPVVIFTVTINL
jgi:hypothetical protein